MARRSGGRGFWTGLLTGIAIAALAALALAWIYPPLQPPAIDADVVVPPGAPQPPAPGSLLTPAPGPVIDGLPKSSPPPANSDGPGSPSLMPSAGGSGDSR